MKNAPGLLSLLLFFLMRLPAPSPASAYTVLPRGEPPSTPSGVIFVQHDANEVRLGLMSSGQTGFDAFGPPWSVGDWPKETENNYIFGGGLWISARADTDGNGEKDYIGVQAYDPMSGGTECAPGRIGDDPENPLSRLFVSTEPQDFLAWPDEFRDKYGHPIVYSLQDIVGFYNDLSGTPLFQGGPYGFQIAQRSMAFRVGRTSRVIIFLWDIRNFSEYVPGGPFTFEDAYIGIDSDMDIGNDFGDDRSSFFTYQVTDKGDSVRLMMAYAWDKDFHEQNFEGIPGFVGVKWLLSPGNDMDGIDNDHDGLVDESPFNGIDDDGDGLVDERDEVDELGLVNYSFHRTSSPGSLRNDPQSDEDLFRIMACDPPTECVESSEATDWRFMMSSGPFEWPPGMTVTVAAAYVFAPPVGEPDHVEVSGDPPRPDPDDPVFGEFLATATETQEFFDAGMPDSIEGITVFATDQLPDTNDMTGPYPVSTRAASSEGIASVRIFFSTDGGAHYTPREMRYVQRDIYQGSIDGTGRGGGEVRYFTEAVDSSYRVARDPGDAPEGFSRFEVFYTPSFLSPDSVSGITWTKDSRQSWFDFDGDGDLDLYLTDPSLHNLLFRNEGGRAFVDVTEASGAGLPDQYSKVSAPGDYDNDGHPDIAIGTWGAPLHLLHNLGDGMFEEVSSESGLTDSVMAVGLSWTDADGDGYADLIAVANDAILLSMNQHGNRFLEEAAERGLPAEPSAGYRGVLCFDADGDADEDVLLFRNESRFFMNDRGSYTEMSGASGLDLSLQDAEAFDVDADGDLDLLLRTYYAYEILINDGAGHFTEESASYRITGRPAAYSAAIGDMNADGRSDIVPGSPGYYILDASGTYRDMSRFFGGAQLSMQWVSLADADGDGLLDVFKDGLRLSAGFPGGLSNHWLEVDLEGTVSNRSAIGALASLHAGDAVGTDFVTGSSQKPHRLHFGFAGEEADSLVIRWPSGIVQVERTLPANELITIIEDSTLVGAGGDGSPRGTLPRSYALLQNYPNPFNPSTTISFDLPESAGAVRAHLVLYDVRGRLVRTLVDGVIAPGRYHVVWDGRDGAGAPAGSGIYLCSLRAGTFSARRKLILVR